MMLTNIEVAWLSSGTLTVFSRNVITVRVSLRVCMGYLKDGSKLM